MSLTLISHVTKCIHFLRFTNLAFFQDFLRVGKIYCYANFFHYANFSIVFGPNFGGGKLPQGGPSGTKPANSVTAVMWLILQTHLSTLVHINLHCPCFPTIEPFIYLLLQDSTVLIFSIIDLVFLISSNTDLSDFSKGIRYSLILRSSDALSS